MERFSALVLTRDLETLRVINRAFEEYGLEANVVRNVRDANELLKGRRFDRFATAIFPVHSSLPISIRAVPGEAWSSPSLARSNSAM